MALKRKADEALTGLFGEYASDDDVSGEDEGNAEHGGAGVVLLQYSEEQTYADGATSKSLVESISASGLLQPEEQPEGHELAVVPQSPVEEGQPEFAELPGSLVNPPKVPVHPALQVKVKDFLASKRERGVTLAGALAKHRGYRNPDFLQKMVEHFDIKECGTCFAKELFDPDALPKEDFYDRLAAEQMAAERRREEARKQAGRVDFVPGKSTTPPAGMAVGGLSSASIVANAKASASSKRSSKWDTLPGRR